MKQNQTEAKLKLWKKKTISKQDLSFLFQTGSDEVLFEVVSDAIAQGFLVPVKASGNNGNRVYPLYLKYKITIEKDYSEALREIMMLHPLIIQNGYLSSKPAYYIRYRQQLHQLNQYLFQCKPAVRVSRKERSFEIFDEEKQLEDTAFCNVLHRLGITSDTLLYYDTPEYCFNDFIPERKAKMTLLICENKDIWFNIRRRMYEDGVHKIFGVDIDGVIYGCGNRISEKDALFQYTRFLRVDEVSYLYWGDIDRAGFNIYLSLIKNNSALDISLFKEAYVQMTDLATSRKIPDSQDLRQRIADYQSIYTLFDEKTRSLIQTYIEENKRIPQEIISYEKLLDVMR